MCSSSCTEKQKKIVQLGHTRKPVSYTHLDPDNRRTYPWGREDKEMIAFHRELIKIHKTYQAFRTGALQMLLWEEHILAYGRFLGEEQLVVVLNNKRCV